MGAFYYKDKIIMADKISDAKQMFEYLFKTKVEKSEISTYDVKEREKLISRLIIHENGFVVPFKNGAYYVYHKNDFNPVGTFHLDKAKVYKRQMSAINVLLNLDWIAGYFPKKEINIDGTFYPIEEVL